MNQGQTTDVDEISEEEEPRCQHHWRIDPPNGATSLGTCKVCGAVREFRNSTTDSIWENDSGESGFRRGRATHEVIEEDNAARRPTLGTLLGKRFTEET